MTEKSAVMERLQKEAAEAADRLSLGDGAGDPAGGRAEERSCLPWELSEDLWQCILLCRGDVYSTSGRGKDRVGAVEFTYDVKRSNRTGELTDELVIDRKENSKTITRSTVELALVNGLQEQARMGRVKGPKKLKVFGASYLYSLFLAWGVINS